MLDAVALLGRGLPTVTVAWDTFGEAARSQARLQGLEDLPLVVVPHRRGEEGLEDQRRKAEAALPAVLAALLEPA